MRLSRVLTPWPAVLVVAMFAASGCGGSSKAETAGFSSKTTRPDDAEAMQLITQADAICKRLNGELVVSSPANKGSDLPRSLRQNASLEAAALVKLGALTPPRQLAGDWMRILAYRRTLQAQLVGLAGDVSAGDSKRAQALITAKVRAHGQLRSLAVRDGFSDCAVVGATPHAHG
jgi:hypothetical protein